jgi:hypothetical protein
MITLRKLRERHVENKRIDHILSEENHNFC